MVDYLNGFGYGFPANVIAIFKSDAGSLCLSILLESVSGYMEMVFFFLLKRSRLFCM